MRAAYTNQRVFGLAACLAAGSGVAYAQAPAAEPEAAAATDTKKEEEKRGYGGLVRVQHRMLAVVDEDPANDQSLWYTAAAQASVFEGGTVFLAGGVRETFYPDPGESGWYLLDTQLGLSVATPVKLGEGHELGLVHEVSFFLPTSRASQTQDLYVAPQGRLMASYEPLAGLSVVLEPRLRYRAHAYAERAGQDGALNTLLDTGLTLATEYAIFADRPFGSLRVGAGAGSTWLRKYASADDHESPTSDAALWLQQYGWFAYVDYAPLAALTVGVAVEQGGSVLRDGVVNTFFAHRDETELAFTLTGTY